MTQHNHVEIARFARNGAKNPIENPESRSC